MPDVLDGRTVLELGNKRIDTPREVGTEVGRVKNRTEKVVRAKREREAVWDSVLRATTDW